MSRQSLISLGFLFLAFACGIALGLVMGGASPASTASEKITGESSSTAFLGSEAQTRNQADSLLSARIRELNEELSEQKNDPNAILADRLAFFKKFPQLSLPSFDENLKVTPIMAEFLKLSLQEQKALEQHLAQMQGEIRKIEQAKITLVKQTDDSVTYEIPAFPEGKALKDQLNDLVAADIGDQRADVFLGESKWEFNELFFDFGEGKMDIQVTRTDQAGNSPYLLKESYANGSSEERPIGALPERYQNLIQLDPAP